MSLNFFLDNLTKNPSKMTTELATPTEHHQTQQPPRKDYMPTSQQMTSSSSWHPSSRPTDKESDLVQSTWHTEQQTDVNQQTSVTQSVLADPNIKFPLENSWSFWFYKNEKTKSWKENVKFITTVDFVEDFWGLIIIYCLNCLLFLIIFNHLVFIIICN